MRSAVPVPIAVVMTSFDPGGTERQMTELVRRLDRARWSVHVAAFHTRGAWFSRIAESAPVSLFPVSSFRRAGTIRQLAEFARWCRAHRISVVHTAELPANIFGLPGAALAGVPVRIGNRREINPGKSRVEIAMQRAAYACAHKIVANSIAAAERLRHERVPEKSIAVIANGLELRDFPARPVSPRPRRRVVVVANLRVEKGHDVLIDAASAVLGRFPDARFEIVGDGPERDAIVARARERDVASAFAFLGHCDDVAARLQAADIFVLPSRSEAFPNALLEAMATGLPSIASAVGGICELVDDGRTGLLVRAGDPAALANRLCRVMGNPSLAETLGSAARADVEARYSFDRMVAAFEDLYQTELAERGLARGRQPEWAAS